MQRKSADTLTGIAIMLSFLLFWVLVYVMSEEIVNDDLDQRPTLHVVIPYLYWLTASYILPFVLLCLILAGYSGATKRVASVFASLALAVFLNWLYLDLVLPSTVLDKAVMAPNKYLSNHIYTLSNHDLQPLALLDCIVCAICVVVLVVRTTILKAKTSAV